MTKSFIIVISIILIVQILSICSFVRCCPVAKAGKVSKFHWKYKLLFGKEPKTVECDGKKVDVSGYKGLYVYGNSMQDYGIHNGNEVFVSEFGSKHQKESIEDYPVLAFHIYDMKYQSPYKLRKFVGYVDNPLNEDWVEFYGRFKNRIKIDEAQFVTNLQEKVNSLRNISDRYILSETFDEETEAYRYSLHPVSSLYAKVLYAV